MGQPKKTKEPNNKKSSPPQADKLFAGYKPDKKIKTKRVDRSLLQQWATCPHQAQLIKEHGDDDTRASALVQSGMVIHDLIEEAIKWGEGDPQSTLDFFVQEVMGTRPDLQPEIIEAAKHVARRLYYLDYHTILGVEKQLEYVMPPSVFKFPDGSQACLTSCLDLMMKTVDDSTIKVWDWKTGYKKRTKKEALNDFQTQFIALLIWQNWPDRYHRIEFTYVDTRDYYEVTVVLNRNELKNYWMQDATTENQFEARVVSALMLMARDVDTALPEEKKCLWCPCTQHCTHCTTEAREISADPAAWLAQLNVINQRRKKMKAAGKEYVKSGNVLKGGGLIFEYRRPSPRFSPKLYNEPTDKPEPKSKSKQKEKKQCQQKKQKKQKKKQKKQKKKQKKKKTPQPKPAATSRTSRETTE